MPGENPAGRLVVLAGPSAVGKSTVVHRLRSDVDRLYFSVSMTTRAPRPGEVDGVDYFFVTPDQFQENIDRGMMLEWADIHGGIQRSGTPAAPVQEEPDDEDDPDLEPEDDDGPDEVDLDTDSDGEQDDVPEAGTVTR